MTQTLRRERRQKFESILDTYSDKLTRAEIEELAFLLADAAESRSEIRGIEAAMFADRPVTQDDMEEKTIREACNEFESALGFGSLPWDSTANWTELRKFIVTLYKSDKQEFRKFAEWRNGEGKYQGCTNKSIRENPVTFKDTHYPTFKAHAGMRKTDEVRPVYNSSNEEKLDFVPAPEKK